VVTVAVTAKLVGCGLGAKIMGLSWRESFVVGVLMNTRYDGDDDDGVVVVDDDDDGDDDDDDGDGDGGGG
jgi:hypothetical protein